MRLHGSRTNRHQLDTRPLVQICWAETEQTHTNTHPAAHTHTRARRGVRVNLLPPVAQACVSRADDVIISLVPEAYPKMTPF